MAENHLDYDYLEDEAIDEHFAEDPVGVDMSCVCSERNRLPSRAGSCLFCLFFCFFLRGFVCASAGCVDDDGQFAQTSTSIA